MMIFNIISDECCGSVYKMFVYFFFFDQKFIRFNNGVGQYIYGKLFLVLCELFIKSIFNGCVDGFRDLS